MAPDVLGERRHPLLRFGQTALGLQTRWADRIIALVKGRESYFNIDFKACLTDVPKVHVSMCWSCVILVSKWSTCHVQGRALSYQSRNLSLYDYHSMFDKFSSHLPFILNTPNKPRVFRRKNMDVSRKTWRPGIPHDLRNPWRYRYHTTFEIIIFPWFCYNMYH